MDAIFKQGFPSEYTWDLMIRSQCFSARFSWFSSQPYSASGEKCGVVKPADRENGIDQCYTKAGQQWPMQCKEEKAASPLPVDYESPPVPWDLGHILGMLGRDFNVCSRTSITGHFHSLIHSIIQNAHSYFRKHKDVLIGHIIAMALFLFKISLTIIRRRSWRNFYDSRYLSNDSDSDLFSQFLVAD